MEKAATLALLQQMLGPAAQFRVGRWEAIELAANQGQRLLVVQRTGWGKSVVCFLAARILRLCREIAGLSSRSPDRPRCAINAPND